MKNIDFQNVVEMNDYLIDNGLVPEHEIPTDILDYDRACKLDLLLNKTKKNNFKISIKFNNNQHFVVIYSIEKEPIDYIDIVKKQSHKG